MESKRCQSGAAWRVVACKRAAVIELQQEFVSSERRTCEVVDLTTHARRGRHARHRECVAADYRSSLAVANNVRVSNDPDRFGGFVLPKATDHGQLASSRRPGQGFPQIIHILGSSLALQNPDPVSSIRGLASNEGYGPIRSRPGVASSLPLARDCLSFALFCAVGPESDREQRCAAMVLRLGSKRS